MEIYIKGSLQCLHVFVSMRTFGSHLESKPSMSACLRCSTSLSLVKNCNFSRMDVYIHARYVQRVRVTSEYHRSYSPSHAADACIREGEGIDSKMTVVACLRILRFRRAYGTNVHTYDILSPSLYFSYAVLVPQ